MEALGEILKRTREEKGYSIDQISRDTNIARRFLEALENEDFSQFPGEPYLLGFLRNYGEYLDLDPKALISAYRTIKIQEQPIPVDELLHTKRSFPLMPVLAGLLVIGVVGFIAYWIVKPTRPLTETEPVPERQSVEYSLVTGQLERRLYIGDKIIVSIADEKAPLSLTGLDDKVTVSTPVGDFVLELGQELVLDINGDGVKDTELFIADMFKNDPDKGVALRLSLLPQDQILPVEELPELVTADGSAPLIDKPNAASAIFVSPSAYPFTVEATFKGFCMFRWESDNKERDERYFHKTETVTIQSKNALRLWISNAGAVKLTLISGGKTTSLEVGSAGEVVVLDLKWIKDEEGRFALSLVRLE